MNRFLPLVFLFFAGCTSPDTKKISNNKKDTVVAEISPASSLFTSCYVMADNKDSAILQLNITDTTVTGKLTYNLFEKDRNSGSIKGVWRDSLLVADYTFQSEGMTSVREMVFKIKGDDMYEGYGDVTEDKTRVSFKNISQLEFQTRPFIKTPCK